MNVKSSYFTPIGGILLNYSGGILFKYYLHVDAMQMASIWYLETYYQYNFPMFPFITLFGAIGLGLIEIKSIYEKAEDKVKIDNVAALAEQVVAHKDNLDAIAKAVSEYMNKKETEDGKG